jgi:hypothetical protein
MLTNRWRRQLPDRVRDASYSKTCGERTVSGGVDLPDRRTELAGSPGPFDSCLETSSQYTSPDRARVWPARSRSGQRGGTMHIQGVVGLSVGNVDPE